MSVRFILKNSAQQISTTSAEGADNVEGSSYRTARFLMVWDKWTGDWSEQPLPPIDS